MKKLFTALFASIVLLISAPTYAQVSMVIQAKQDLRAAGVQVENVACSDFEIAKLVAARLKALGAGLLTKDCCGDAFDPNRTHCLYEGTWFAHDIVAFKDGTLVDIAIDGGGTNGPNWDPAPPDPSLVNRYRSAADLGLSGLVPGTPAPVPPPSPVPAPTPSPAPVPVPSPSTDYTGLLQAILASQAQLLESTSAILVVAKDTNQHVVNIDRTFAQTMGTVMTFVGKYVAPALGGFIAAKKIGN